MSKTNSPQPPREPEKVPRFDAEPYRPDGGFSAPGLIVTLVATLLGAIAVGWLMSFVGQYFYLLILFPIFFGFLLMVFGFFGASFGKMRNTFLAGVIGLCAAALAITTRQYFDYLRFLPTREEQERTFALFAKGELQGSEILDLLHRVHRADSFPGYVDYAAHLGLTVTSARRPNDKGFSTGFYGTLFYWGIEIAIVTAISFFGLRAASHQPFCLECQSWKENHALGVMTGDKEGILSALREGDLQGLRNPDLTKGNAQISGHLYECPNCRDKSSVVIQLEEIKTSFEGVTTVLEIEWLSYPGEALSYLKTLTTSPAIAKKT